LARKEITITIDTEGRDQGKVFFIREMSARRTEKWAARAIFALAHAGVDIPSDINGSGIAGVALLGVQALMHVKFEEAEPLLDEMFECVQILPDPKNPDVRRFLIEDDIEEVTTRLKLRMEVFNLHVGFSVAGEPSSLASSAMTSTGSPSARTSPAPSIRR
jgi:hypothetical protein